MEENKDDKNEKKKKVGLKKILSVILAVIFILISGLALFAYYYSPSENTLPGKILSKLSYPIVVMEGRNFIYTSEIRDSLSVLRKFYESEEVSKSGLRADFDTEDGKKRLKIKEKEVLNREIENRAIEIISKKRGISLKDSEINDYFDRMILKEDFLGQNMADFAIKYGWGEERVKEKIVKPIISAEKLNQDILGELEKDESQKKLIENAKKDLEEGKDFSEVAKKYSDGLSGKEGGDLGWVSKDQILPEVSAWVFSGDSAIKEGFEIINSPLGYHIVKVHEFKKEGNQDLARLSQIIVRKKTFADWLGAEMAKLDIKILDDEYYWDEEKMSAEFRDESMRSFEEKARSTSEGEASISKDKEF